MGDVELLSLAMQLSDGSDPDWGEVEAALVDGPEGGVVQQLHVIAEIGRIHSTPVPPHALSAASMREATDAAAPADASATGESDETVIQPARAATPARTGGGQMSAGGAHPTSWGHLDNLQLMASGGFGHVYRAWESTLQFHVALKLLKLEEIRAADRTRCVDEMLEEGRRLARVDHPNVIRVHGADERGGRFGLWMELIDGRTLDSLVSAEGPFSDHEATGIMSDVCKALSAVHHMGIVHRDISARNVMREKGGRIVLMDFGAGCERRSDGSAVTANVVGTPYFMAPEVLEGHEASVRSDIYGAGVLLYYLLTGGYPFEGNTVKELIEAHRRPPRLLRDVRSDLTARTLHVVDQALARRPEERFATVGEMSQALTESMPLSPPREAREPEPEPQRKRVRWRRPALALATAVVGAGAIWLLARTGEPQETPLSPGTFQVEAAFYRAGDAGPLRFGDQVRPGDALSLELETSHTLFAYVVNRDETGEIFVLFPDPSLAVTNPLGPGRHRLPGLRAGKPVDWEVTSSGQTERFWLMASRERLTDVEIELATLHRPDEESGDDFAGGWDDDAFDVGSVRSVGGFSERDLSVLVHTQQLFDEATPLASASEAVSGTVARYIEFVNPRAELTSP